MPLYIITYDVRTRPGHDYQPLWDELAQLKCAHLQNSVWLGQIAGTASSVHSTVQQHLHPDDTLCVIELPNPLTDWTVSNERAKGLAWLQAH